MRRLAVVLVLWAAPSLAEDNRAGSFDYYVMSLSWSPTWCALEGDERSAPQCREGGNTGWMLHGLWPQFERGWPSFCRSPERDPSRRQTAAMADVMGSPGLAWHQWRKHGRCTGLSPEEYFGLSRAAFASVTPPDVFSRIDHAIRLPASVVEDAFLDANPQLDPDMITITCRSGRIQEARVCLSKDLEPRTCGADVARDCRAQDALLDPIR